MPEWIKKRFKKGKIGFGGSGIEAGESTITVDVKKFVRTIDNYYRAVEEGRVSFCPSKEVLRQATKKWDEPDSKVKDKLNSLKSNVVVNKVLKC